MAGFVQTIKDWQRMCDTIKSCDNCPMQKEDGWTYVLCSESGISAVRPEVAEKVIIKWAAENPEPVYPTWWEWLSNNKIIAAGKSDIYQPVNDTIYSMKKMFEPIPADIAQKLGIEPKER